MTTATPTLSKAVSQRIRELAKHPSIELAVESTGDGYLVIWRSATRVGEPINFRAVANAATREQATALLHACRDELARMRRGK